MVDESLIGYLENSVPEASSFRGLQSKDASDTLSESRNASDTQNEGRDALTAFKLYDSVNSFEKDKALAKKIGGFSFFYKGTILFFNIILFFSNRKYFFLFDFPRSFCLFFIDFV